MNSDELFKSKSESIYEKWRKLGLDQYYAAKLDNVSCDPDFLREEEIVSILENPELEFSFEFLEVVQSKDCDYLAALLHNLLLTIELQIKTQKTIAVTLEITHQVKAIQELEERLLYHQGMLFMAESLRDALLTNIEEFERQRLMLTTPQKT